jgi:hypothetical protein
LMAELLYGPDFMFQAEDRAHRIGQTKTVFIRYLMMKGSTDDILWKMITGKTRNVGRILDNRAEFVVAQEVSTTTPDGDGDGTGTQRTMEESIAAYQKSQEANAKRHVGRDDSIVADAAAADAETLDDDDVDQDDQDDQGAVAASSPSPGPSPGPTGPTTPDTLVADVPPLPPPSSKRVRTTSGQLTLFDMMRAPGAS